MFLEEDKLQLALELRKENNLTESNRLLIELATLYSKDAYISYQCAWSFDCLGEEASAVTYYEKAILLGDLKQVDLENAYLGLGSTFRVLGEYEKSKNVLQKAVRLFPENQALRVFYAMTLYNLNKHEEAMRLLLKCITNATSDINVLEYKRAIDFYSSRLDETVM